MTSYNNNRMKQAPQKTKACETCSYSDTTYKRMMMKTLLQQHSFSPPPRCHYVYVCVLGGVSPRFRLGEAAKIATTKPPKTTLRSAHATTGHCKREGHLPQAPLEKKKRVLIVYTLAASFQKILKIMK
jgi:hypothetical protein